MMVSHANAVTATDPLQVRVGEIENDREFKAHVYQQLVDLQPFLSPESQVSVLVQVEKDEEKSGVDYVLSLVATLGEYRIEVEGRDEDLYIALRLAKQKMVEQLDDVYGSAIDSTEREVEIQTLLQGGNTLH
jgi:ribosome-associated translation inhibitor RaiA